MIKKIFILLFAFLIASCCVLSLNNVSASSDKQNYVLKGFSAGFYKVLNEDKAVCTYITSKGEETEIFRQNGYEISKALCSESYLYVLAENGENYIIFSLMPSGSIEASYVPDSNFISDEFTADDKYFYFIGSDRKSVISVERSTLSLTYNYFSESISKIFCHNEKTYAVTPSCLYCLDKHDTAIKCDIPDFDACEPIFYGNIYADSSGKLYSFSSDSGFKYIRTSKYNNIFMLNNTYYAFSGNSIYQLTENDAITAKYVCSENIDDIAVNGNKIALLFSNKVKVISEKSFTKISGTKSENSSNSSSNSSSSSSVNANKQGFTDYTTDGDYIIIPKETTAAVFKKHINLSENSSIAFFSDDNEKVSSGVLGTGFLMKLYEASQLKATYTIIVMGDVTGEGSVNTRDKRQLTNYLLGKLELNKAQLYAAELSGNEKTDSLDLLLLQRSIENS